MRLRTPVRPLTTVNAAVPQRMIDGGRVRGERVARDFLHEVLGAAVAAAMESPAAVNRLERELRRQFGGTRRYIAKRPPAAYSDRSESPSGDAAAQGRG